MGKSYLIPSSDIRDFAVITPDMVRELDVDEVEPLSLIVHWLRNDQLACRTLSQCSQPTTPHGWYRLYLRHILTDLGAPHFGLT